MGVWGHCPQKILKFNSANLFIFSTISRQIALPSVVFHSFTAYIRSYLLSEKSPLHFVTSHNTVQQSQLHTWQSQLHFLCQKHTISGPVQFCMSWVPRKNRIVKGNVSMFLCEFSTRDVTWGPEQFCPVDVATAQCRRPWTKDELINIFLSRVSTDARYWYSNSVCLSVCLSVRDVTGSDENGLTYYHNVFTTR